MRNPPSPASASAPSPQPTAATRCEQRPDTPFARTHLGRYRAALLGFFYFQYVVRRYRSNALTVQATSLLVERTDSFFHHRYVPTPLRTLYSRLKTGVGFVAEKLVQ
jgi:hypothetical protein